MPYKPRGTRERILFDGHLFTFDKLSYDCKKRFYRCERKNVCPARVHTPIDCDRVIHKAQMHNHPPPTENDLAPYNIDVTKLRTGFVMHVNPVSLTEIASKRNFTSPGPSPNHPFFYLNTEI